MSVLRDRIRRAAALAAVGVLCAGCVSLQDYENAKRRAEAAEQVNRDLQTKSSRLLADYERLQGLLSARTGDKDLIAQLTEENAELKAKIRELVDRPIDDLVGIKGVAGMQVNPETGGLILPADMLFASGQAVLKRDHEGTLKQVAAEVKRYLDDDAERLLFIDGYTDEEPVTKTVRENLDNWFLGARRAHAVMAFLRDECGIAQPRMVIAGMGHLNPILVKAGVKQIRENRRVELRVGKPMRARRLQPGERAAG